MSNNDLTNTMQLLVDQIDNENLKKVIDKYGEEKVNEIASTIKKNPQLYLDRNKTLHIDLIEAVFSSIRGYSFFILNFDMIRTNLEEMIRKDEGIACCHDKSGTLMREVNRFILTREYQDRGEDRHAFYYAKGYFKDVSNAVEVFEALHYLRYGSNTKLLNCATKFEEYLENKRK